MRKTPVPVSSSGDPPRGNSEIKVSVWGRDPEQAMERYERARNESYQRGEPTMEIIKHRCRITWQEAVGLADVVQFPFQWGKRRAKR